MIGLACLLCAGGCSGKMEPGNSIGLPGAPGSNDPSSKAGDPTAPGGSGEAGGDGPKKNGDKNGSDGKSGQETAGNAVDCGERLLPDQPLRRLSSTQYHNTLRDLFGDELARPLIDGSLYPVTAIETGFTNDAEANVVNTEESIAIEDNAARIAGIIVADPEPYLKASMPCAIDADSQDGDIDECIGRFVEEFGLRAYRRPLREQERDTIAGLYEALRADQSAVESWAAVMQLFVQAPAMLYRIERGGEEVAPGIVRLSDYEMASRLSYFFLDSMPDEALFAAAAAGELSTPEQVADQARRLMETPRFAGVLEAFHRDWLRLYTLERADKDPDEFPELTSEVRTALQQESGQLVRHVLSDGDGSIASLLGGTEHPVNSTLASFYGVDADGADEDTWVPVELPQRRGLLTEASFMAAHAGAKLTSPIHRGAFFMREVLCRQLPAFPGNIDTKTPLQDTSGLPTARQRLSPLLENGTCAACHTQFNPTGLAFENYDAIGRWRATENDATIDGSGSITLDGQPHDFADPVEFAELIAESAEARDCYALQWYRSVLGRREFAEDQCSLQSLRRATAQSGGDLRELMVALTQTDAFLYRKPQEVTP